jgi:hypothetical protein
MALQPQEPADDASITLACRSCHTSAKVPAAAKSYACDACHVKHFIRRCARCHGAEILVSSNGMVPSAWSCPWCLHQNMTVSVKRSHRAPAATAADAWQSFSEHRMIGGEGEVRVCGGFSVIGGSGDCPPIRTVCSVVAVHEGVLVVAEIGANGGVVFRYEDLLGLEVGGRGIFNTGAVYAGRGHGITGAIAGMAIASMLTEASQKTVVDSFLRITSRHSEVVLSHWKYPPQTIRNGLSMMFVRYEAAARTPRTILMPPPPPPPPALPTPVEELERLTRLHAAGTLTDSEFEEARAKHIQQINTRNT